LSWLTVPTTLPAQVAVLIVDGDGTVRPYWYSSRVTKETFLLRYRSLNSGWKNGAFCHSSPCVLTTSTSQAPGARLSSRLAGAGSIPCE
jgi:hypothetical protein